MGKRTWLNCLCVASQIIERGKRQIQSIAYCYSFQGWFCDDLRNLKMILRELSELSCGWEIRGRGKEGTPCSQSKALSIPRVLRLNLDITVVVRSTFSCSQLCITPLLSELSHGILQRWHQTSSPSPLRRWPAGTMPESGISSKTITNVEES